MNTTERLERVRTQQEATLRRAFISFLAGTRSKELVSLVDQGQLGQAQALVDQHIAVLANAIPQIFTIAASAELDAAAEQMDPQLVQKASVVGTTAVGFDPTHDRAVRLMRDARLNFVQQFTTEQRSTTRSALATAFQRGLGTESAARLFRDSIGLTRTQQAAVDNYRRLLELRSPEALTRGLRDQRFDQKLSDVIDSGGVLSSSQIDRMVDRYRDRMLAYRAENIARTESHRIQAEAQQEATAQLIEQTGIDERSVFQVWNATQDGRTRDSHFAMDGQRRRFGQFFTTPSGVRLRYPGDPDAPAGETINCRCVLSTEIARGNELEDAA